MSAEVNAREVTLRVSQSQDPVRNLTLEEEMFEQVEAEGLPDACRLWVNEECLVKGKAKSASYGWYDEELTRKLGIRVLERSTGGGVVYHDWGNLNWTFCIRINGSFLSPTAAFGSVSAPVIRTLAKLGVPATFSPPNRIEVRGYKVSGMAGRSTTHTLLVHGTLLLRTDLERLNALCIPPAGSPPVANLSQWAPSISISGLAEVLIGVLREQGCQVSIADL